MVDRNRVYEISGKLQTSASSSLGTSLENSGNLNVRRGPERNVYSRHLNGEATKWEVGQSEVMTSELADAPSWTQSAAGLRHGFIQSPISSSRHESTILNAYGTASYYSKKSSLKRLVYTVTASAQLSDSFISQGLQGSPSTIECLPRSNYNSVSGSFISTDYHAPISIEIPVPEYGKIRDIKVWVEFVHDHRGGTGPTPVASDFWQGGTGTAEVDRKHGLQGVQIALRSPNTNFPFAHPTWNDPSVLNYEKWPDPGNEDGPLEGFYSYPPELLKNSYLLWAGHSCEDDLGLALGGNTGSFPNNFFMTGTLTTAYINSFVTVPQGTKKIISACYDSVGNYYTAYYAGSSSFYSDKIELAKRASDGTWSRQVIAMNGQSGPSYPNLIQDTDGHPILIYEGQSSLGGQIWLSKMTGANSWVSSSISTVQAKAPSAAVNPATREPALSCCSELQQKLYFMFRRNGSWEKEVIAGENKFSPSSLCFKREGTKSVRPAVAFLSEGRHLSYAISGSSGWVTERARDDAGTTGSMYPNLHFDDQNRPLIVHYDDSSRTIVASLSGATGWITSAVTPKLPAPAWYRATQEIFSSVYRSGTLHVLYTAAADGGDGLNQAFYYTVSGNAGFYNVLLELDYHGMEGVLLLDRNSNPEITYLGTNYGAKYARKSAIQPATSYAEYDTDIDMRTIFTDSSRVPNPRHLLHLYDDVNNPRRMVSSLLTGHYPSPHSASVNTFNYRQVIDDFNGYVNSCLNGNNFPWMLDTRIPPGNFLKRSYSQTAAGIPTSSFPVPTGWLTGPSGTAASGEFPTRGMQIGPETIKPVYPLLEDVYAERIYTQTPVSGAPDRPRPTKVTGFRPGLRGTEINGTWKLMFGTKSAYYSPEEVLSDVRSGIWFRQARIEFVVEQGEGIRNVISSRDRRFDQSGAGLGSTQTVQILSGSSFWDVGVNRVYIQTPPRYGRNIGISNFTGSLGSSAVITKLTGSLASDANVSSCYLDNEFGTPFVPISSGSLIDTSLPTFTEEEIALSREVLKRAIDVDYAGRVSNTLDDYLSRAGGKITTRDDVSKLTDGSEK